MPYPVPRRVEITPADLATLTPLEAARVSLTAGVPQRALQRLIRAAVSPAGASAEDAEAGARVVYAAALQLERRLNRELTWQDAESWNVQMIASPGAVEALEAEADAEVAASIITGVPVRATVADLTVAHIAAFGRARDAAAKNTGRRAPRRAG